MTQMNTTEATITDMEEATNLPESIPTKGQNTQGQKSQWGK